MVRLQLEFTIECSSEGALAISENLIRVHQPLGVNHLLDLAHEIIALAMFELHELALADAHPVLTRAGTPHLNGFFHDGMVNGFEPRPFRLIFRISHENNMQVAVARVSENIAYGPVLIQKLL